MVTKRKSREARRRAGSEKRDAQHRGGGEWTTLTIPDGVDIWQPKKGSHRIDIVPFAVGKGNPYAAEGELYYERTYYIHRGVGPNNDSYICLAKTFDKPCPICEYRAKRAADPDADDKELKDLKPKERQLWLVHDRSDEGKVKLWEFSHFLFGELLDMQRRDAEDDERHVAEFDDPDGGSQLKVSFEEKAFDGNSFLKAYNIDFRERKDGLPDGLLDHGICLDDLLKEVSYDRLKAIFHQEEESNEPDDGEPEEKPKRKKSPPVEDDDDKEEGPKKKKTAPKKGKKKPVEDSDNDEWDDDFDDEKESPLSDDDDDDDWSEDDDD